jgi:phage virion morphogenesis protein
MSGFLLYFDLSALDGLEGRINRLAGFDRADLFDQIGAVLESSTRERIGATKRGPLGEVWPAWSPAYAATRRPGHSLLVGEQSLLDSIQSYATADQARVGSDMIYAAIQHFGADDDGGIPARPYLGISDQDEADIRDLLTGVLGDGLGGGVH